jgi:hypothetical protein
MHYVDSVQSRGLLLVVPSVDEIGHDVGYCSRRRLLKNPPRAEIRRTEMSRRIDRGL